MKEVADGSDPVPLLVLTHPDTLGREGRPGGLPPSRDPHALAT